MSPEGQILKNNALKMRRQLITQRTDPRRLRIRDIRLRELVRNEWKGVKSETPNLQ